MSPYYAGQAFTTFMIAMLFISLISIASQVFLALAVYNDAKGKGNNDPMMWALLVGFLGWIPGIIYLCIRNNNVNKMIYCPQCNAVHAISVINCPHCGIFNVYAQPFNQPIMLEFRRKAKNMLIAGLVSLGVSIVVSVIGFIIFFSNMITYATLY